jgi:molybdopterin converting factor small subunit
VKKLEKYRHAVSQVSGMQDKAAGEETPRISIRYLGLARLIAGTEEDAVPWPREGTVGELLDILCERYGREFQTSIFTLNRTLQNYVRIEVDEVDIDALQGLETSLKPFAGVKFILTVASLAGG